MDISRKLHSPVRSLLAAILIAVTALSALPASIADAAPPPIKLSFNSGVTTPLILNNVKPGDSGTKTITLQNIGTESGIITIWSTNLTNTEGLNPKSETGDTSGPGELGDHFFLDIEVDGLSTNVDMPVAVNDFPKSYISEDYVEIMPIKANETKTISIHWELPWETGNEIQGDELTFTINYLLQQTEVTELTGVITPTGNVTTDVEIYSETKKGKVLIKANTTAKTADNQTPTEIWIVEVDNEAPKTADNITKPGLYYDAGPDGTTFDTPLVITLSYDESRIPIGVDETELYIALWNETTGQWERLNNSVVNVLADTVSAEITHFSRYTVLCRDPGTGTPNNPTPPATQPSPVTTPPVTTPPEEPEELTNEVQVNLLDEEGIVETKEDGSVPNGLTLEGPDGDFIITVKPGGKITDTDGVPLSRIELEIVEKTIVMPDGTVLLTPVYQLVGYDGLGDVTDIWFDPPAVLNIHYDADALPEFPFMPWLVTYTDQDGMITLEEPSGTYVGLGWTQGLISSGGYFFAVTEYATPMLPLPAYFSASNLVISPTEIDEGNPVRISVTMSNDGEEAGTHQIYLIIDGIVRAIREVSLSPKSSEMSTFEISNLAAGTHTIKIANLEATISVNRVDTTPLVSDVNWLVVDLSVAAAVIIGLAIWLYFMRKYRRRPGQTRRPVQG